jgi:hypothetical protein
MLSTSNIAHNDEPNKTLQNPKWSELFLEPFKGRELSKNKVQWLDLAFRLWPALKGLPFAKTIYTHFAIILQFSSYFWLKQFEGSSSMDLAIAQLPIMFSMSFISRWFNLFIFCLYFVCMRFVVWGNFNY